jgi:hypothetical protein
MGPRAGLGNVEKKQFLTLPGFELRPLGRPARIQSLSWLHISYNSVNNSAVNVVTM